MDLTSNTDDSLMIEAENAVSTWFQEPRHVEEIEGFIDKLKCKDFMTQSNRDQRVKTVSVALVLCLNLGVDPPGVTKPVPCARMEGWVDPQGLLVASAEDRIANALQRGYERWQPRARPQEKHSDVTKSISRRALSFHDLLISVALRLMHKFSHIKYKHITNPDIECVRKLCVGLRRNSRDDRIIFHYNGHGVPPPTNNAEIWLFNSTLTQYLPYPIAELLQNTGSPSMYVWDCNSAGTAVNSFVKIAEDQKKQWLNDLKERMEKSGVPLPTSLASSNLEKEGFEYGLRRRADSRGCFHLAACSPNEILPMDASLPADLFSSCLLTPVRTSVVLYMLKNQNQHRFPRDFAGNIPGIPTDRRTLLGELNWIFTAITDTIAWNVLPDETFQKLFRHDLLVASLFRSFLLAQRVLINYNCHPISKPDLPTVNHHPLWDAWDYTIDCFLSDIQESNLLVNRKLYTLTKDLHFVRSSLRYNVLVNLNIDNVEHHSTNSFFSLQLKAFETWLEYQSYSGKPPLQLPILLQMLLSQFYRSKALELMARFLDLGPWAIQNALSVGIFPYVLKILISGAARELKPWLAFIWAKILVLDPDCQVEIFKESDRGCVFFMQYLNDPSVDPRHRVVPAFVIAALIQNNFKGAQVCLTDKNFAVLTTELLLESTFLHCPHLRLWLLIGLGRLWADFNDARWQAIRLSLYEKVQQVLTDKIPEVRAAAVYALGCLVKNSSECIEQAASIHHTICRALCQRCTFDGSVLVRSELLVALQWFIIDFENQFANLSLDLNEKIGQDWLNDVKRTSMCEPEDSLVVITEGIAQASLGHPRLRFISQFLFRLKNSPVSFFRMKRPGLSASFFATLPRRSTSMTFDSASKKFDDEMLAEHGNLSAANPDIEKKSSSSDFETRVLKQIRLIETKTFKQHSETIWLSLLRLSIDPEPKVAKMAQVLINHVEKLALTKHERKRKLSYVDRVHKRSEDESAAVTFTVGSPDGNPMDINDSAKEAADISYGVSPSNHNKSSSTLLTDEVKLATPQQKSDASIINKLHPPSTSASKKYMYTPTISSLVKAGDEHKKLPAVTLISTDFVPWCSKMFLEPIIDLIQIKGEDRLLDAKSVKMVPSDWALHTAEGIQQTSKEQTDALIEQSSRCDHQRFSIRVSKPMSCLAWSELRPHLYVCDGRNVSVWRSGVDRATCVHLFDSFNGSTIFKDEVCDMHVLNGMTREILMTCSENGLIRIWDPCYSIHSHAFDGKEEMISTAYLLNDLTRLPTGGKNNTVYNWNQESGRLVMAGNLKVCRIWDAHAENVALDINLQLKGRNFYPTCLSTDSTAKDVVAIGLNNGEIHLYDIRVADSSNAVARIGYLGMPIVGVGVLPCISSNSQNGLHVIAGSSDGELCLWEPRMFKECIWRTNVNQYEKPAVSEELVKMETQKSTKLLACATKPLNSPPSKHTNLKLFDISGRLLTNIQHEEHTADAKSVPRALRFHNLLISVAVATDTQISAYEVRKSS